MTDSGVDSGTDAGPSCGDGILNGTEQCDDQNAVPSDGCTSCMLDPGAHDCVAGQTCEVCGDGSKTANEACDDGNRNAGDGCSADCTTMDPYTICPVPGQACEVCGDGLLQNVEVCDDGANADGDGCSADCSTKEANYECYPGVPAVVGPPAVPQIDGYCERCGNSVKDPNETCDDGNNTPGDGCEANCKMITSTNWTCTVDGTGKSICTLCGNSIVDGSEVCDDGAKCNDGTACTIGGAACADASTCAPRGNDGCTAFCSGVDGGYVCPPTGGACAQCNDGVITAPLENCEDGNTAPGDGCSTSCVAEQYSTCPVDGSNNPIPGACRVCGDYIVQPNEDCDDGGRCSSDNTFCSNPGGSCGAGGTGTCAPNAGDGCNTSCTIEPGWLCPNKRQCGLCGNAIVDTNEVCDDGARCSVGGAACTTPGAACGAGGTCLTVAGDGCEATCQAETTNFDCFGSPSVCEQCGNGTKTAAEPCDDGNNMSGDGCSLSCQIEPNWQCEPNGTGGSQCGTCGDGIWQASETCDDGMKCTVGGAACTTLGAACGAGGAGLCQPASGDGCEATCQALTAGGWQCYFTTINSQRVSTGCALCGNGDVETNETCDDSNTAPNDGCTAACVVDSANGWTCPTPFQCKRCGDGVKQTIESCDNGGTCSSTPQSCLVGTAGSCPGVETCAPVASDGCNAQCTAVDPYYTCVTGGSPPQTCTLCGDGTVNGTEACDDTNHNAGDGCSSTCAIESGWSCNPGNPSVCGFCGNGIKEANEVCDDRNTVSGDGCQSNCQAETAGWDCYYNASNLFIACSSCGDSVVGYNETCDTGPGGINVDDGCTNACAIDTAGGWTCPTGTSCRRCGDGVRQTGELCDDRGLCTDNTTVCTVGGTACPAGGTCTPRAGDGCAATCTAVEQFYTCTAGVPGDTCVQCGDGTVQSGEFCDDANHINGDGCSRTCTVETSLGYACQNTAVGQGPSTCQRCGNGKVEAPEVCDNGARCADGTACPAVGTLCGDGSTCATSTTSAQCADGSACSPLASTCTDGSTCSLRADGCNTTCTAITPGYNCFSPGFACVQCGNGILQVGETCDDNNFVQSPADGCDQTCHTEATWQCPIAGQPCTRCGDGVKAGIEGCDDRGRCTSDGSVCTIGGAACPSGGTCTTRDDDGCSAQCQIESGYICTGTSCSAARCGDGVRAGIEQCDDGNTNPLDGCSAICKAEPGYACPSAGGTCSLAQCGDRRVEAQETCDNGGLCSSDNSVCDLGITVCPSGGTCTPRNSDGCSSTCTIESGYTCTEFNGCATTACNPRDGNLDFPEACDDGNAVDGDGCQNNCTVTATYACVNSPSAASVCNVVVCGDGKVQGTETCDDLNTAANDGCSATCAVEPLYTCPYDTTQSPPRSKCRAIVSFVETLVWNISSLNPNAIWYDPTTRSFIAYKVQSSQPPIELCLDGTILREGGGTGMIDTTPTPALQRPWLWQNNVQDAVYDPATKQVLLYFGSSNDHDIHTLPQTRLAQGQADLPASTSTTYPAVIMRDNGGTELGGTEAGMAIGENGVLYLATQSTGGWYRYARNGATTGMPFVSTASAALFAEPTLSTIQSGFVIPGYNILGTFTQPTSGSVLFDFNTYVQSGALTHYTTATIPGLLFPAVSATSPARRSNLSDAASSTTDGGGFVICGPNPSEPCSLFAASCTTDEDCAAVIPGTQCVAGTSPSGEPINYCTLRGRANDDFTTVAYNSMSNPIDVLANDNRGEGICKDPAFRVQSVVSPTTRGGTVTVGVNGTNVLYTPPTGFCGSVDTFTYTALLGGGQMGTATVSVLIACVCGDGIRQSNEQCDNGGLCSISNAACTIGGPACASGAGTCTARNNDGCDTSCRIEVVCGDGIVGPGEECDNRGLCSISNALCTVGGAPCAAGEGTCTTRSNDGCTASTCQLETPCGDGVKQGVEECDPAGPPAVSYGGSCTANCTLPYCGDGTVDVYPGYFNEQCDRGPDVLGDDCSPTCQTVSACGDGTLNAGEQCDDRGRCADNSLCSVGVTTCADASTCATVSNDGCSAGCTIEYCGDAVPQPPREACDYADTNPVAPVCKFDCTLSTCGDGVVFGTEECDDANGVNDDACTTTCLANVCGNGRTDVTETCDDGNTIAGDGCSATCQTENLCGNGNVNVGEECDDGNTNNVDSCSNTCDFTICGDGNINPGEQCEPPSTATCTATCQRINQCGDGVLGGTEQCDDGGICSIGGSACTIGGAACPSGGICSPTNGTGSCDSQCRTEVCGNGILNSTPPASEACDDGNLIANDGCSPTCTVENLCGNGVVNPPEACDDGNSNDIDSCRNNCTATTCGDGNINPGEQCEPPSTTYCTASCQRINVCGDGVIGGAEQCDNGAKCGDGSNCTLGATTCAVGSCTPVSGDGCRGSTCTNPPCGTPCTVEVCGDTFVDAPMESCDDGNTASGDNCSNMCFFEMGCGNGVLDAGEQCDDGDRNSGDGCSAGCVNEWVCGDGSIDPQTGEQCDPGGLCPDGTTACQINNPLMACPSNGTCTVTSNPLCNDTCHDLDFCGNGNIGPGEQCDDGNSITTDGCVECQNAFCGDGYVRSTEECDPLAPTTCTGTNKVCSSMCECPIE